jgi:hypothetical protein
MENTEPILIDSLNQTSKRIERFLIGLIILTLYSYITIISGNPKKVSIYIVEISTRNNWYFFVGATHITLLALTGSQIINYIMKRTAFETQIFSYGKKEKNASYDILPLNNYELLYEYFIGADFTKKRLQDNSRRLAVLSFYSILHGSTAISLTCIFKLIWCLFAENMPIVACFFILVLILIGLVVFFLWKSFYDTLERRRKHLFKLKNEKYDKSEGKFDFIKFGWARFRDTIIYNHEFYYRERK